MQNKYNRDGQYHNKGMCIVWKCKTQAKNIVFAIIGATTKPLTTEGRLFIMSRTYKCNLRYLIRWYFDIWESR